MSIQALMANYQPETKLVELNIKDENGNITEEQIKVAFVAAPVQVSRDRAQELLRLLDGSLKTKTVETDELDENGNKKRTMDFDLDFTKIIANFSSGAIKGIEAFILKNSKVEFYAEGEWHTADMTNKEQADFVFTLFPKQYYNFMIEGIKFHFSKHLPSGTGLLANLANKAVNKAIMSQLNPMSSKQTGS